MRIKETIIFLLATALISVPAYAKKDKDKHKQLPPGLQKKAAQGKPLPPGWQKKLAKGEILDRDLYKKSTTVVPVDPHGFLTVRIEGKLIRLHKATREIIEIFE